MTHGCIHNTGKGRCLVPLEHLLVMGLPVFEGLPGFPTPIQGALADLSAANLKKLAGNAMCLPQVGAMLCYLLSNVKQQMKKQLGGGRCAVSASSFSFISEGSNNMTASPPNKMAELSRPSQ